MVFVFSTTDKDTLTLPLPPLTLPPILDEWRLERERERAEGIKTRKDDLSVLADCLFRYLFTFLWYYAWPIPGSLQTLNLSSRLQQITDNTTRQSPERQRRNIIMRSQTKMLVVLTEHWTEQSFVFCAIDRKLRRKTKPWAYPFLLPESFLPSRSWGTGFIPSVKASLTASVEP